MSIDTEDLVETKRRKKKEKKSITMKLPKSDYEELERLFGKGKAAKGVRESVKSYLYAVSMPEDDREKLLLMILRELIDPKETEEMMDWEVVVNASKQVDRENYMQLIRSLDRENYIRVMGDKVRVSRKKLPNPIMEFITGGMM